MNKRKMMGFVMSDRKVVKSGSLGPEPAFSNPLGSTASRVWR